jgi:hypothetical protein
MKINGEGIYGSKAWKKWGESASDKPLVHQGKLSP